ncbi:MAG: hypothetical protein ACKVT1_07785 [Dehalococcoidia bacterium]
MKLQSPRRSVMVIGCLTGGFAVALALAAASDTIGLRFGNPPDVVAADPPMGSVADQGHAAIRRFEHSLVSPVATDGRFAYYAAMGPTGWQAMVLDPEAGVERVIGPVGDIDGILVTARTSAGTVFAGSARVVLVGDDGSTKLISLPAPVRDAGLEGPPYVEGIGVRDDRVLIARFNDRDLIELNASAGLSVVAVHEVPDGVSPPKHLRILDDRRVLVATAYSSQGFNPGAWVLDLVARRAEPLVGLTAPDAISASGPLVFLHQGRVVRVGADLRIASTLAVRGPGLAAVAAGGQGETWYHNHRGPGEIVWSGASPGSSKVFALPTFFGYPGEPAPEEGRPKPMTPVASAPGVRTMVTMANGDLVFATSGHEFIGIIRNPVR